ncbi:hypothetical protein [Microlunatus sp. Y2014]|uniref:hypothetical protein n=1 Tax=Microlunatus sp. Y2014 TaxID=3418488 RepID=UPI003DA7625A
MLKRLRRRVLKPLTLAQVLSSAAGATPMLVAAVRMGPTEFATFAVVVLVATLSVGGARAVLLQPALIQQRVDPAALVPLRYTLVSATVATLAIGATALLSGAPSAGEVAVIGIAGALPVVHDWLRYRGIGTSHRWAVAVGDGVRLVLVLTTLLPVVPATTTAFMVTIGVAAAAGGVAVVVRVPRRVGFAPYRGYRASALWQGTDFVIGQLLVSLPLIVLAALGTGLWVAGARLGQTLVGPLNLVFAATSTNLLADATTTTAYRQARSVISRGWRASIQLALVAAVAVGVLTAVLWLSGFTPQGVSRDSMLLGVVLVGVATMLTGWSGIHAIVLRVLGHQASVTTARLVVAVVTVAAFVVGFLLGGERLSLVLGFGANAVTAPLVLLLVAARLYRKELREEGSP